MGQVAFYNKTFWVLSSLSLSPENLDLYLSYFADFVCSEDIYSNSILFCS